MKYFCSKSYNFTNAHYFNIYKTFQFISSFNLSHVIVIIFLLLSDNGFIKFLYFILFILNKLLTLFKVVFLIYKC